ncbi:hypothetical protein GCM10023147_47110 [Tsukamurella soli]|uniref:Site-specific DNA recombinase n=1 Tax=Tsukamurella soli TaxID=644556 RepID=A0ABP8KD82_9ACTN
MNPVTAPPSTSPSKTAITYLRVSTADQATRGGREEGFSIPAQREANTRKAASLDAAIVAEFVDAGESGTSAAKRPELQRMLAYVREHPVDYCIVHKLDRLARSRADDVSIHFALKQAGVTLVSTSENIDETPSGMLMHGIMSSIAEFYSRNLANEVTKGLVQKASLGGTVSRAPLGYKNIHVTDDVGRINRTVAIDPERAHLITWAFYRYAEGDCSLSTLLDQLTDRGLTTRATPKWPSKPVSIPGIHKIMTNPYYKGEVHYRGVIYAGSHEPLVDPATWQQVQDRLGANRSSAVYERRSLCYLRGSVYCGSCGSRLMVIAATNRFGTTYDYMTCSGRQRRTTSCERQAMRLTLIEELIEDEYRTIALSPELRDHIETLVLEDFDHLHATSEAQRQQLDQQRIDLEARRKKLLDAHYAGAVPLDLLKTEQDNIASQLDRIATQLANAASDYEGARAALAETLDLTRDCHAAYLEAGDATRRLFNQAFFSKIYIDEDDQTRERTVRVDYNQPFDDLLSRLVPAKTHHAQQAAEHGQNKTVRPENRTDGVNLPSGSAQGTGCLPSTLVELRGFEPLTPTLPVWCATSCAIAPYSVVLPRLTAWENLQHRPVGSQIAWWERFRSHQAIWSLEQRREPGRIAESVDLCPVVQHRRRPLAAEAGEQGQPRRGEVGRRGGVRTTRDRTGHRRGQRDARRGGRLAGDPREVGVAPVGGAVLLRLLLEQRGVHGEPCLLLLVRRHRRPRDRQHRPCGAHRVRLRRAALVEEVQQVEAHPQLPHLDRLHHRSPGLLLELAAVRAQEVLELVDRDLGTRTARDETCVRRQGAVAARGRGRRRRHRRQRDRRQHILGRRRAMPHRRHAPHAEPRDDPEHHHGREGDQRDHPARQTPGRGSRTTGRRKRRPGECGLPGDPVERGGELPRRREAATLGVREDTQDRPRKPRGWSAQQLPCHRRERRHVDTRTDGPARPGTVIGESRLLDLPAAEDDADPRRRDADARGPEGPELGVQLGPDPADDGHDDGQRHRPELRY